MVGTGATRGANFGDADTTQKATGATSAQIDFVCVICTSNSSTSDVASFSLPLSLCVSLFKGTIFFRSYNEVFVQTAFIPYFPSGKYYFSICDHGPDSLHAVYMRQIRSEVGYCPPDTSKARKVNCIKRSKSIHVVNCPLR